MFSLTRHKAEFRVDLNIKVGARGFEPPPASVLKRIIGARGFEPPTSASRTLRATKLRYAPLTLL